MSARDPRARAHAWLRLHLLAALAFTQIAAGWRVDGTGVSSATPPVTPTRIWATSLGWSNASPVMGGDKLYVAVEPTTLAALDPSTGRVRWQVATSVVDTLPADQRPGLEARLAALPGLQAALAQVRKDVADARRQARSSEAPADIQQRISGLTDAMDALTREVDQLRPYTTPADLDLIGYSSPTPWTDGQRVVAMFGNGVVAAFDTAGQRRWAVWLGAPVRPMRGYEFGSVVSPQVVDGVLVVAHRALVGLDLDTGRELWRAGKWDDYGTPAVA